MRPLYGGTDHVLEGGLLGTRVTWTDAAGIAAAIEPDTGLVIVETPANPTLELLDLRQVADAAGDVPVLVDNTFATPVLQRPAEFGATLVLHSATKYLGGHGDVMGGVVAADRDWVERLRRVRALTGGLLHPMAAYLLHRGLRTLPVRVRAQQETAMVLAERLLAHPAVARVHYPGLPGQDPAGLVGTQLAGPGSIIALELAGGYDAAARFTESCELVTHAVSLGGVDSLVQHPASLTHRPVAGEAKPGAAVVRLSIGLEHVDDLTADLMAALDAAAELVGRSPRLERRDADARARLEGAARLRTVPVATPSPATCAESGAGRRRLGCGVAPVASGVGTGLRMPIQETTPPTTRKTAVAIAARWYPPTSSCVPTITPRLAIATRPAMRATALLTAEPMPARAGSTAPRIAAVSGATVIAMPRPTTRMPGQELEPVVQVGPHREGEQVADGDDDRPERHEDARTEARGEAAEPRAEAGRA